ncbi:MAG: hypothetical protein ACE5KD_01080 [Candidatus Bathyarchaeia archaeon]
MERKWVEKCLINFEKLAKNEVQEQLDGVELVSIANQAKKAEEK